MGNQESASMLCDMLGDKKQTTNSVLIELHYRKESKETVNIGQHNYSEHIMKQTWHHK